MILGSLFAIIITLLFCVCEAMAAAADDDDDEDDDGWLLMLEDADRQQVEACSVEYPVILLLRRLACSAYEFAASCDEFRILDSKLSAVGSYIRSVDITIIGADVDVARVKEPESFSCTANEFASCTAEGTLHTNLLSYRIAVPQ